MRVLFDGDIFSSQRHGGVSRYFTMLARGINQLSDADCTVLAPLHVNRHLSDERDLRVIGGRIDVASGALLPRYCTRLLSPCIGPWLSADVVHETYFCRWPYFASSAPRVVTVHDMVSELIPFSQMATVVKRAAVARADKIICISENTRRDLCRLFNVEEERTEVVHHGFVDFGSIVTRDEHPAVPRPYFLFVGRRSGYKNWAAMIKAFASSRLIKQGYSIVCFGDHFAASESAFLEEQGIPSGAVVSVGGSDERLADLYRSAVALVYPSRYEGFGFPLLEAMSAGCIVACSDTSSLPEVAGNAAAFFDPNDVDDIRFVMEAVAESDVLRSELRACGYERCRAFSWDKCVSETVAAYRSVVR